MDVIVFGCFEIVGRVVVYSIFYDGFGFVGFVLSFVEYLVIGFVDVVKGIVSLNDILDLELK